MPITWILPTLTAQAHYSPNGDAEPPMWSFTSYQPDSRLHYSDPVLYLCKDNMQMGHKRSLECSKKGTKRKNNLWMYHIHVWFWKEHCVLSNRFYRSINPYKIFLLEVIVEGNMHCDQCPFVKLLSMFKKRSSSLGRVVWRSVTHVCFVSFVACYSWGMSEVNLNILRIIIMQMLC